MVDNLAIRLVVSGSQVLLGECQANSISNTLTKRAYTGKKGRGEKRKEITIFSSFIYFSR